MNPPRPASCPRACPSAPAPRASVASRVLARAGGRRGRLAALENAFLVLVDCLAERGAIDPDELRRLLSQRARAFRTDHGAAEAAAGTAYGLDLLAGEISGSTQWLRREHD